MAKKTLQIKGLRQRWMLNTIMPVLVLVILAVCLFSASITSYYYTSMESTLKAQARSDAESFNSYSRLLTCWWRILRTRTCWSCSSSTPPAVSSCPPMA